MAEKTESVKSLTLCAGITAIIGFLSTLMVIVSTHTNDFTNWALAATLVALTIYLGIDVLISAIDQVAQKK